MKTLTLSLVMLAAALLGLVSRVQGQTCTPPTNVAISNVTNTRATVSFTPSATASSYTVRFYSVDSTAAGITSINTTASPVTLTGLVAGRFHRVSVMSNCVGGFTTSSSWVGFQTTGGPTTPVGCAAPSGLSVTALSATSASVSFTGVSGNNGYRVVYFAVGDSSNAITRSINASPASLSGLLPNTPYVVRIFSNCSGLTSTAARITFRTPAAAVCGAVSNIVVTGTSATTATVSFTPGAGNTSFHITYHLLNDSTHWVNTNASPATLTGLVPGQTYYIQITSVCGTGASTTYTPAAPLTYSFRSTLAAREALGAGTLNVYPNPAQRAVNLLLPALPGAREAQVRLVNATGQQVRRITVPLAGAETRVQLNLAGLAPGLYTVQVQVSGQTASQRLVVE